jgi:ribosome recycling factor
MIDEALDELKSSITKAHESLKRDLSKLRTGRASPELLESIRVDYYGTPTPIQQMATVSVPEARLIVIKPWDRSAIQLIEKAIATSPVQLTPQNDGEIIRIPIPSLTEERRKEIVKLAREYGEKCKIALRDARHEAKDMLKTIDEEGEAGADEIERAMKKLEELVREGAAKVDEMVARREKDILEL